jgi:hypothetical protein
MHMQVAGEVQGQNDKQERAYADGVIVPVPAVWPNGKTPHKGYDNNYRENKEEGHDIPDDVTPRESIQFLSAHFRCDACPTGIALMVSPEISDPQTPADSRLVRLPQHYCASVPKWTDTPLAVSHDGSGGRRDPLQNRKPRPHFTTEPRIVGLARDLGRIYRAGTGGSL